MPYKVGLIGFGLAGKVFHAPLIAGSPRLDLSLIVSSRADEIAAAYPGARAATDPQAAFDDAELDLVVVATPNDSHFDLARRALAAGKAVVVDKPMAVCAHEAETLTDLARDRGVLLSAFHNRRWDDDFLALKQVIASGALGKLAVFESRFDRFRTQVQDRWRERPGPAAGLLWDLGSHLIDQALQLFGDPDDVAADLAIQREGGLADDYFNLTLRYGALRVILRGGSLAASPAPRFRVDGDRGGFVSLGLDGQEAALRYGLPLSPRTFDLTTWEDGAHQSQRLTMPPGAYADYYEAVALALDGAGPNPAPGEQATAVIRVIEAAELSSRTGRRTGL